MSVASVLAAYSTGILEISGRRGKWSELCATLKNKGGLPMPAPCRFEKSVDTTCIWISPATILCLAPPPRCSEIAALISPDIAAVNDQSAGYVAYSLETSTGAESLSLICRLDLVKFKVGESARTLLGQIPATLWRQESRRFGVLVSSTLARALSETFAHVKV